MDFDRVGGNVFFGAGLVRASCRHRQIVAHAEMESVPLKASWPAVLRIILISAPVIHEVNAATVGSER
jgi:hypothetical protein